MAGARREPDVSRGGTLSGALVSRAGGPGGSPNRGGSSGSGGRTGAGATGRARGPLFSTDGGGWIDGRSREPLRSTPRPSEGSSCERRVRNSGESGTSLRSVRSPSAASPIRFCFLWRSTSAERQRMTAAWSPAASATWTTRARTSSRSSEDSASGTRMPRAFFASPRRMAWSARAAAASNVSVAVPPACWTRTASCRTSSLDASTACAFASHSWASLTSPSDSAASAASRNSGTDRGVVSSARLTNRRASLARDAETRIGTKDRRTSTLSGAICSAFS